MGTAGLAASQSGILCVLTLCLLLALIYSLGCLYVFILIR